MKSAAANRKRVNKRKQMRLGELNYMLPEQFILNADAYLHYSNAILFEISRIETAVFLLIISISANCRRLFIILLRLHTSKRAYVRESEFAEGAFEGVIERYCGVPP